MTRKQMKSHFIVHTNGQDEWIKVDKRTYDKAIDMFCDTQEAEIEELRSTINRFVEEAAMYSNALDRNIVVGTCLVFIAHSVVKCRTVKKYY